MENNQVAIFLDFENLALSADTVYPSKHRPLLIEPIVDYSSSKGNIALKKAYADWTKGIFAQYTHMLMHQGFELIHLPETNAQGKNGSDVRLAIDVMESLEMFPLINSFIVGSGDSDFIPLIQRVRSRSKNVVVIGFEHSVGKLVKKNSNEFKSLEELLGKPEEASPSKDLAEDVDINHARELLLRFTKTRGEALSIKLNSLKRELLKLDPSFSEKKYGFNTFRKFINTFLNDLVLKMDKNKGSKELIVHFKELKGASKATTVVDVKKEALNYLNKKAKFQYNTKKRKQLSEALFYGLNEHKKMTMNEMNDFIYRNTKSIPKIEVRKYVNTLFAGQALKMVDKNDKNPLLERSMTLRSTINNVELLEQIYIGGMSTLLKEQFDTLEIKEIRELLQIAS